MSSSSPSIPGRARDALPIDPDELVRLHQRLALDAAAAGLDEVVHRTVDSPVGPLLLAATTVGLVRVAFAVQDFDAVLDELSTRISPRLLRSGTRLDAVARQLEGYFAAERTDFDLPLDHQLSRGFAASVHAYLPQIGYGQQASYGAVARAVGHQRAVRAVGTACARNPLPIVVPCHRVIRSDGSAGQYAGGAQAKATLLELERTQRR